MKTSLLIATGLLGAVGLAACDGNSSTPLPPPPADTVPLSASASVSAYTTFNKQLVALSPSIADTAAPYSLETVVTAPVSESDDPVILD